MDEHGRPESYAPQTPSEIEAIGVKSFLEPLQVEPCAGEYRP